MAPLSKLTLTSYRRAQPHRDPVEERRSKTLAALAQQKLVLEAALKGQEHTMDLSRFSAAPSSHLSGYPFESQGAFPA